MLLGVKDACAPKEDVCALKGDVCTPMKSVVFHEVMFAFSKEGDVFARQGNGYAILGNMFVSPWGNACVFWDIFVCFRNMVVLLMEHGYVALRNDLSLSFKKGQRIFKRTK